MELVIANEWFALVNFMNPCSFIAKNEHFPVQLSYFFRECLQYLIQRELFCLGCNEIFRSILQFKIIVI